MCFSANCGIIFLLFKRRKNMITINDFHQLLKFFLKYHLLMLLWSYFYSFALDSIILYHKGKHESVWKWSKTISASSMAAQKHLLAVNKNTARMLCIGIRCFYYTTTILKIPLKFHYFFTNFHYFIAACHARQTVCQIAEKISVKHNKKANRRTQNPVVFCMPNSLF